MQIDFSQVLIGYDGEVIKTPQKPWEKDSPIIDMTLKIASVRALTSILQDERATGEEKFKRNELARLIHNSNDFAETTVEDAATIKRMIGAVFGPIVVGASWPKLDGKKED